MVRVRVTVMVTVMVKVLVHDGKCLCASCPRCMWCLVS
jgi:hypothetical protein